MKIKPFNVIDQNRLPEIKVEKLPIEGDPMEIKRDRYFI
jgi:hypothetical protein